MRLRRVECQCSRWALQVTRGRHSHNPPDKVLWLPELAGARNGAQQRWQRQLSTGDGPPLARLGGEAELHYSVSTFTSLVAAQLVRRDPTHLTLEFSKADRDNRIYVDVGLNGPSATFASAYAVRARAGAPVSAPCTWEEIEQGRVAPQTLTLRTMGARVVEVRDLWRNMYSQAVALPSS